MATPLIWAVIAWCRARGKSWESVLKKLFKNTERHARVMASISGPSKVIPAADCRMGDWSGDIVPILARLFPRSLFAGMLRASLDSGYVHNLTGTPAKSGGLIGMVYGPPESVALEQKLPPFSSAVNGGKANVLYTKNDSFLHVWLNGGLTEVSHSHYDVGSFVLEANGEKIFEDPGTIEYCYNDSVLMKLSCMHNCITPVIDNNFINQIYPVKNMMPYIHKSRDKFTMSIDCCSVWDKYFSSYKRTIKNCSDDFILINDAIKCHSKLNVAFHLHSTINPEIEGNQIKFFAKKSCITVDAPWSSEIQVKKDTLHYAHSDIYHISIIQANTCDIHDLNTKIFVKNI